jgi:hypothetical protein
MEIHSYFVIDKTERFLEVISNDSKEYQEIIRPFTGNDCFHGHPVSPSEACVPSVQPPATQDEYLGLDWTLDPARLAAAFRKCGLDPSRHFDITVVSAKRAVNSWKWADVQQASTIKDRLSQQQSNEIVISGTESSTSGQSMGPKCLFRGRNYESLGSLVILRPKSKLPPSR